MSAFEQDPAEDTFVGETFVGELTPEPDPAESPETHAENPGSMWAQLADTYEHVGEQLEDARLTLDVNADASPVLCARYKWIDPAITERLGKTAQRKLPGSEQALFVAAHTVALACDEVGFRHPATDELVSHPDGQVRFDARLAKALRMPEVSGSADKVLAVVMHAFARNGWAVIKQAEVIGVWLADPTSEVNEAFLGKSETGRR